MTHIESGIGNAEVQQLIKSIFSVDRNGKIQYAPEITSAEFQNMHAPLSVLFNLWFEWGQLMPPPSEAILSQLHAIAFKEVKGSNFANKRVYEVTPFSSSPLGIFQALRIGAAEAYHHAVVEDFIGKIAEMEKVVLMGAVSPSSIYALIKVLEFYNFNGEVTALDLSEAPIAVSREMHTIHPFTTKSSLNLMVADVTTDLNDVLGDNTADLVISDILGIYLTHVQYRWFSTNINSILRSGGFHATREMTETQEPVVGRLSTVGITSSAEHQLLSFIQKHFPHAKYEEYELADFLRNRWPVTFPRLSILEYMGENVANTKLKAHWATTPDTSSSRLFETSLFQKD